jgi:hypothetical protein
MPSDVRGRILRAGVAVLVAASGCTKAAPTAPTCETQNTGTVRFRNSTEDARIFHNVVWDGVQIVTRLAAQQTSEATTAVAGVAHTLVFRDATTSAVRCSQSTPILIRCQDRTISCAN